MITRLMTIAGCFLALSAFSSDDTKTLSANCAASLVKAKEMGRRLPPTLVDNRNKVCGCIAEGLAKEKTVSDADKKTVSDIYKMGSEGKMADARKARGSLAVETNAAMRKLTRSCTRAHANPKNSAKPTDSKTN